MACAITLPWAPAWASASATAPATATAWASTPFPIATLIFNRVLNILSQLLAVFILLLQDLPDLLVLVELLLAHLLLVVLVHGLGRLRSELLFVGHLPSLRQYEVLVRCVASDARGRERKGIACGCQHR